MKYKKLYTINDVLSQPMAILDNVDLSDLKITKEEARKFYYGMSAEECKKPKKHGIVAGWTENVIWPTDADWLCRLAGKDRGESFENQKICIPTYYLHNQDKLTGKNIGIATIYKEINPTHLEYSENIAHYETLYPENTPATLDGCAVASTEVGKTCGAAPGSKLHYFAAPADKNANGHTDALKHVIEHNRTLPDNNKIRFLVCPWNDKDTPNYQQQQKLFKQCEQEGMMVIGGGQKTFRTKLVTYSYGQDYLREDGFGVCIDDHVVAHPNGGYVLLRYGGVPAAMACIAGGLACVISVAPEFCNLKNWQQKLEQLTYRLSSHTTGITHEFCPGNMTGWVYHMIRKGYLR